MDSIWERDSISRGSASVRESNNSYEEEALCPKCDLYMALSQGLILTGTLQGRDCQAFSVKHQEEIF